MQAQSGTVRGFVTGAEGGEGLVGATVVLGVQDGEAKEATTTRSDGFYRLSGFEPGQYVLRVSFVGYQSYRDTLQIEQGETRTKSVSLEPTTKELQEVIVQAEGGAGRGGRPGGGAAGCPRRRRRLHHRASSTPARTAMSILSAYAKALGQLTDPRARSVIWLGIALAAGVFVLVWATVGWLLTDTALFQNTWLDSAVDVLGGLAVLAITWFLFPAVVSAFIAVFLDRVASAVERRHYPDLPAARDVPILEEVATALRFLAVLVALNLVALLFLLIPPVFPFVYYGVNGYLLGREYFEMVAARRLDAGSVRAARQRNRAERFLAGLVMAFLLTVPIVNLVAPVVGTAAMVHLFHGGRGSSHGATARAPATRSTG